MTKILYVEDNEDNVYMLSRRLKRKGFDLDIIKGLEKTFKLLIKSKASRDEVNAELKDLNLNYKEVEYFVNFIKNSERGVTR